MNNYLLAILREVNTIIIPGLGALTVTNQDTGEIMLIPYLKHDEGTLSSHIAEKEGISENDAKNLIAKFVREIMEKLDRGDSYDMFKFGRFTKEDGEVTFTWWGENSKESNEEINTVNNEKKIESPDVEEQEVIVKVEEIVEEKIIVPTPEEEKVENTEEKITIDTSQISPEENVYIPKEELPKIKEEQEKKQITNKKTEKENTTKEKSRKKSPLIWMLPIIFILVGGACVFIFKDQLFKNKTIVKTSKIEESVNESELEKTENEIQALEENLTSETETIENTSSEKENEPTINENEKTPTFTSISGNGNYHVIAGAFSSEGNAQKFLSNKKGEYQNCEILGRFDDKELVSFGAFDSKEQANSFIKEKGLNAWVFYYVKK